MMHDLSSHAPTAHLVGEPIMLIDLSVGPPVEVGTSGGARRRCIPILGGTVTGMYHGEVQGGGADWQQIGVDGTIEIEARYVLQLADGPVEVDSRGLRTGPPDVLERLARGEAVDPQLYYFRTAMRFRTPAPALDRLNRMLAISSGERLASAVRLTVHEIA